MGHILNNVSSTYNYFASHDAFYEMACSLCTPFPTMGTQFIILTIYEFWYGNVYVYAKLLVSITVNVKTKNFVAYKCLG